MGKFDNLRRGNQQQTTQQTTVQPTQKVEAKVETKTEVKEPVVSEMSGLPQEIVDMRDFVAENIIGIRQWRGNEGGDYATLRLRDLPAEQLPSGFANVAEVAEELTKYLADEKQATGHTIFADFSLVYERKNAQGRLIKARPEDNTLIVALNIEYNVSRVKGNFLQMKGNSEPSQPEAPKVEKRTFSFGRG